MNLWTQFAFILAMAMSCVWADKLHLEQTILNEIFNGYDRRIRPLGENGTGPVDVYVSADVNSLTNLDEVNMVYTARLFFRQHWHDERLKYNSQGLEYVTLTSPDRVWIPDVFFIDEMKGHVHKILTPNNHIRIFPDGTVFYSTGFSLELFCPMNLRNYPMDKQVCSIIAASYGYTSSDIVFFWRNRDPVLVRRGIHHPKFFLDAFYTYHYINQLKSGEYSCVRVDFHFSREFTFYLLHAYMPTMSLVILSWITFWLHPRSFTIRLGIGIGVLLTMIIVTTSVAERGPLVFYIKAMDVWMGTCIVFIFCVLLEMVFVNNTTTKDEHMSLKNQVPVQNGMCVDDGKSNSNRPSNFTAKPLRYLNKYSTQGQRIDAVSRILFPAAFAFFNLVYWLTYTSRSEI